MEMDNPRRPFGRSREPGLVKKPRLTEDPSRQFTAAAPRYNSVSRGLDVEGGAYQPQQLHQELVNQYKKALAELIVNSKPIITNLTIIAGENIHAAKAIVATVCANILEVSTEQKLPSLYLLDSIVKNIQRDYIKYFAARLPEVFCKTYRQVDDTVRSSMRHLFGTWKGVFPLVTLQMIERELGFPPILNGSSSGATPSRPDLQSQRPPNSIHVNPKYLERQRLQQTSGPKGLINDMTGAMASSIVDAERPDRAASMSASRPMVDPAVKIQSVQHSHRDSLSEPIHEKNIGGAYGDYDCGSDLSRNSGLGTGRTTGRVSDQGHEKPWYGSGSNITETITGHRNGFNVKQGFPNNLVPTSANADVHLQQAQNIANRKSISLTSWKNSDEEEFMWDMHSRLSDHDAADISNNSLKDQWALDGSENLELDNHFRKLQGVHDVSSSFDKETSSDSLSAEQKDQSAYGHQMSSPWQLKETTDGLIRSGHSEGNSASLRGYPASSGSALAKKGGRQPVGLSHTGVAGFGTLASSASGSNVTLGTQRFQSARAGSPFGLSPMHQCSLSPSVPAHQPHQNLQNLAERDYRHAQSLSQPDLKTSLFPGLVSTGPQDLSIKDSLSVLHSNTQLSNSQKIHLQDKKGPFPAMTSFQLNHNHPPQLLQSDCKQPVTSGQSQKPCPPQVSNFGSLSSRDAVSDRSNSFDAEASGQSSTSSLLDAVLKSGVLNSSVTDGLTNQSLQEVGQVPLQSDIQPPLPSKPPPSLVTSSGARVVSGSLPIPASHGEPLATTNNSCRKLEQPSLPLGPPPSSLANGESAKTSSVQSKTSSPISNLLSSLVAKGLISASKNESDPSSLANGESAKTSSVQSKTSSPISNLFSSLVAKGLISASKNESESQSLTAPQIPSRMQKKSPGIASSSPAPVSSVSNSSAIPTSSTVDEVSLPVPVGESSLTLSESTTLEIENPIGLKFKPDVIRGFHQSVISILLDDFPNQCSICGLRLKLQEQLDRHLEWHALKKPGLVDVEKLSRRWYANLDDWVAGREYLPLGLESLSSVEDSGKMIDGDETMVPSDDNQCACVLCGELFEDYYSPATGEWMFRGAVYMTIPSHDGEAGATNESSAKGPIVHASCVSENMNYLRVISNVKVEKDR